MKIRFKARRISGKDPVTFRNPKGEAIVLNDIGDVSQDLDPEVAYNLCNTWPDVIEVVTAPPPATVVTETRMAKAPENKLVQQPKASKRLSDEESPITPTL